MPSWRGWNEEQGRGTSKQVETDAMAGFTAINASPLATAAEDPPTKPATRSRSDASSSSGAVRKPDAASAISTYLGIGQHDKKAAPAVATHLQKPSKKGRKRGSTAQQGQSNKRQKSDNTLSNTKTNDSAKEIAADHSVHSLGAKGECHAESAGSISGQKVRQAAAATLDRELDTSSDVSQAVSVYAPITSMDVLDSTSARTSLDSVMASGNRGCVVYQTAPSNVHHQYALQYSTRSTLTSTLRGSADQVTEAQPVGAVSPRKDHTDTAVLRRPRKAKAEAIQKNTDLLRGACGKAMARTAPVNLPLSNSQSHVRQQSTADTFSADESIGAVPEHSSVPASQEEDTQLAFGNELDDTTLLDLAEAVEYQADRRMRTPTPRKYKQNLREVDEHEDYGGALLSASEREFLSRRTSVYTQDRQPIIRPPFPRPILDRSPITGASTALVLRTCFRLGEALNVGSQAARTNSNVMIELYARVMSSWREPQPGRKQHFVFADLYHDKAPHLEGTFELFNQAALWDLDSQVFLESSAAGSMCRAMVRMRRDAQQKWRFEVLSIWQASWEDVNVVWGITGS